MAVAGLCLLAAAGSVFVSPAVASVAEDAADAPSGDRDRIVESPPIPDPAESFAGAGAMGFAVWSERRLGFSVGTSMTTQSEGYGYDRLSSFDLVSGEVRQSVTLPQPAWTRGYGREGQGLALDREAGLLYVAYQPRLGLYFNAVGGAGSPEYVRDGRPCATQSIDGLCPTGIHVMNAETLEVVGDIPLRTTQIDALLAAPQLLALHAAPNGKVLTVLTDRSTDVRVPFWILQPETSPYYGANAALNYLAQFDAASGTLEWMVRLDGCRGARESRDSAHQPFQVALPGAAAVVRETGEEGQTTAVWAACHTSSARTAVMVRVPLQPDGSPSSAPVEAHLTPEGDGAPAGVTANPPVENHPGPDNVNSYIADQAGGRILMQVLDGGDLVWWVFDIRLRAYVGTIGIGNIGTASSARPAYEKFGFDREHGLLYSLTKAKGLLVAGTRSTPLTQALAFPEWAQLGTSDAWGKRLLMVLPGDVGAPSRLFVHESQAGGEERYRVLLHHRGQAPSPAPPAEQVARSLDLDEIEGVTASVMDGAARGYGARAVLVGGIEGAQRLGPADPYGAYMGVRESPMLGLEDLLDREADQRLGMPTRNPCMPTAREATLGFVGSNGPAVVDGSGARGAAAPLVLDGATQSDAEAPASRCTGIDWAQLWQGLLFGRPPLPEPTLERPVSPVGCSAPPGGSDTESSGDAVGSPFAATMQCEGERSSGHAYARGLRVADMDVAEALSSFRIYRDPGRGIVSRVESVARGVHLHGLVQIQSIRGSAESWANGRRQPVAAGAEEVPNCDMSRTAGTCFNRHLFGVRTAAYSCGPCGDEAQLLSGMARAFGSQASFRLREPDSRLAAGTWDGALAAVQKPDSERFADLIMNQDLLQTTVPVLEIVRYAPGNRHLTGGPPRGRQIYQFAGVEVSSSYAVQCLLVYDEEAGTCAPEQAAPGSLRIRLEDVDGTALAGGVFEVRQDVDGDQVLGLGDVLLPDGVCVTGDDGVGGCAFPALPAASYLVTQTAAPNGHAVDTTPFPVQVEPAVESLVTFVNVSSISTVRVTVTDEQGAPLVGAAFALFPDPDADGRVAIDASPSASCVTDAAGVCTMQVPAGSWVLVQTGVPAGVAGVEPLAFAFASGGQTASVDVVNHAAPAAVVEPAPESPAVRLTAPAPPPARSATVPLDTTTDVPRAPQVADPGLGAAITRVIRAPGDALALLARDPMQALAWSASLGLLWLAASAVGRRRQALALLAR